MKATFEKNTAIPLTNLFIDVEKLEVLGEEAKSDVTDFIRSVFGSKMVYLNSFRNWINVNYLISLYGSKVDFVYDGKIYYLNAEEGYFGPDSGPQNFFYLMPGDRVTLIINCDTPYCATEVLDDLLGGGDYFEIWRKWFKTQCPSDEISISEKLRIRNRLGLHARSSNRVARAATAFDSTIYILADYPATTKELEKAAPIGPHIANAKGIVSVMHLAAPLGSLLEIDACGPDAKRAVEVLSRLVADSFGEE